jgi:hypothetical protein
MLTVSLNRIPAFPSTVSERYTGFPNVGYRSEQDNAMISPGVASSVLPIIGPALEVGMLRTGVNRMNMVRMTAIFFMFKRLYNIIIMSGIL